jgi:hypothetical protein
MGCTSPSFPNSGLPNLPSRVLSSNSSPVSLCHPKCLSIPFISLTHYNCLLDLLVVSFLIPTHLSSLHFILSLFTSSPSPLHSHNPSACSINAQADCSVTAPIAYPVCLLHNTQFFQTTYSRLYIYGGIWRKQACPNGDTFIPIQTAS